MIIDRRVQTARRMARRAVRQVARRAWLLAAAFAVLAGISTGGMSTVAPSVANAAPVAAVISVQKPVQMHAQPIAQSSKPAVVARPSAKSTAKPTECAGKHIKVRNLYIRGTHKRVGELNAYYSVKHHGTLCGITKLLGKYRGLPKAKRWGTGVYVCFSKGDECTGKLHIDSGYFKYQAGPVHLTHVNGRHVQIYGYSGNKIQFADTTINTKGKRVVT